MTAGTREDVEGGFVPRNGNGRRTGGANGRAAGGRGIGGGDGPELGNGRGKGNGRRTAGANGQAAGGRAGGGDGPGPADRRGGDADGTQGARTAAGGTRGRGAVNGARGRGDGARGRTATNGARVRVVDDADDRDGVRGGAIDGVRGRGAAKRAGARVAAEADGPDGGDGTVAVRRRSGGPRTRGTAGRGGGPYDEDEIDLDGAARSDRTDFGALLLPVPDGGVVDVEPSTKGKLQAVHIGLPGGRLSVSALAAPTTGRLWPELAKEINTSLRAGGARVRSFQGRWGRELRARTGGAFSVFIGIDGPRWMVYGVATGPEQDARALDQELRRVLGDTVVVRGRSAYPVRTVLPLVLPEDLQAGRDARLEREQAAAAALQAQAALSAPAAAGAAATPVAERAVAEPVARQPAGPGPDGVTGGAPDLAVAEGAPGRGLAPGPLDGAYAQAGGPKRLAGGYGMADRPAERGPDRGAPAGRRLGAEPLPPEAPPGETALLRSTGRPATPSTAAETALMPPVGPGTDEQPTEELPVVAASWRGGGPPDGGVGVGAAESGAAPRGPSAAQPPSIPPGPAPSAASPPPPADAQDFRASRPAQHSAAGETTALAATRDEPDDAWGTPQTRGHLRGTRIRAGQPADRGASGEPTAGGAWREPGVDGAWREPGVDGAWREPVPSWEPAPAEPARAEPAWAEPAASPGVFDRPASDGAATQPILPRRTVDRPADAHPSLDHAPSAGGADPVASPAPAGPALAFLGGDPMALFVASPPGRHRKGG